MPTELTSAGNSCRSRTHLFMRNNFFKIFKERKKPATAKKPKESKGEKKGKTFAIEHQDHQIMTTFLSELTNHVLKTWNISLFLWINLHLFTSDSLNIYTTAVNLTYKKLQPPCCTSCVWFVNVSSFCP